MPVFAHLVLLRGQHLDESDAVIVLLERFEQLLLRLGHRAAQTMSFTLEFADVDARAGCFGHDLSGATLSGSACRYG